MADIEEAPRWWPTLRRIEEGDPVIGGDPNPVTGAGMSNIHGKQNGDRLQWLLGLMSGSVRSVIDRRNDPPVAPVAGDAYLTDSAPTGAFAGNPNRLTIWSGAEWMFWDVPEGMFFIDEGGAILRMYNTGAIASWRASGGLLGPVRLASASETLLGTEDLDVITPATLAVAQGRQADNEILHLYLTNRQQPDQTIPPNVATLCTNMIVEGGNAAAQWNGSRFTVDANTLGTYLIYNGLNTFQEAGEGAETWLNGVKHRGYALGDAAGTSSGLSFCHVVQMTTVGDYLEFFHFHKTASSTTNPNSDVEIFRLIPYVAPV